MLTTASKHMPIFPHAQTLTGHTTEIDSLCFDAAEKSLVSGSRGGSIKFWDMDAGKCAMRCMKLTRAV